MGCKLAPGQARDILELQEEVLIVMETIGIALYDLGEIVCPFKPPGGDPV